MHSTIRAVRLAPVALAAWLVAGCSGFSPGQADPGAAGRGAENAGQKAQDFAVGNGRFVAAALVAVGGALFVRFLARSWQVRIIVAVLAGGAVVYFAMGGGK